MSYMIRGLEPDQQYEAKVTARNRYGWSEVSERFTFSTSSNDSEMRGLSVTYYSNASKLHPTMCIYLTALIGFKMLLKFL
ncbi:hypothetical protein PVAND_001276 [Polypedilum vanderplanki]|uniref:Fibronectin type-III domain-containing protein n=1 Tax=Polypedilum vanderplanki TaxID=319348 RepID=A0A9J6BMW7_POLVA|nr:hypothetical protein PVAND_001276 [Polypedilum vanderplanki]